MPTEAATTSHSTRIEEVVQVMEDDDARLLLLLDLGFQRVAEGLELISEDEQCEEKI